MNLKIRLIFGIFCCLLVFSLPAQRVRWANKVISVSSEYSDPLLGLEFRALHILGKPSKYPAFSNSPSAWQSLTPDNPAGEYIIVSFDSIATIKQVAIFENFGAGSIVRVDGLDENNKLILLKEFSPGYALKSAQVTTIHLPSPSVPIRAIKVSMNSERVRGYSQIDAIGISDSDVPIEESLKLNKDLNAYSFKENLGKEINSPYNEICPVISPDGKKLYFTRWKHPSNMGKNKNQDIWVSNWQADTKTWSKAELFPEPINNDENNAVCGISPNGKTMLLNNVYRNDGQMEKGVSMSFLLRTGDWSFPKALKILNFKNKSEFSEYSLAPNGKILVMTTEMKDSFGGKDIYVSFWKNDDSWTEPRNIGQVVNTGESESTPFIAPDGVTMYFSSSGHVGYGNNDIFLTRRLDDTWLNWSEPENLGPIVNTPQWDGYFSVAAQGDYAYFSSVENSLGAEDIYRIKIPEKAKPLTLIQMAGQILNQDTQETIAGKILVKSVAGTDSLWVDYDPYLGDYSFMWPAKKAFTMQVVKDGYICRVEKFDYTSERNFKNIQRNLLIIPIQLNKQYQIPNINFDQSKAELIPSSYEELDKIVKILKDNSNFKILLEGHTDNQGDWNENMKLSLERVENVKAYIVSKGISPNRVRVKGWGGTKPMASNMSEERRKLNRRVEFTLQGD
ncbi:Photosystem I P700 chlorophyll a apoprotein A2 [Aquirufa nivalisilvae]|uniref:Photosystem I P700 chlorophyll a apoprotein A2 n=1 Tax=Aquirufa nivalisilvae TaxID=2516557 RepID=A0A2S2DVA5_9BACT|nr:OmpA family protein [Aquirufa nivalisilvae]AWL09305.1 Photosystem I P700 chlorophyll a apoprotein A2 [Aquirufa nivalisilvae]MCZ2480198.1 OmpA family protein [Aquirufa nivalisilvae]